MLDLLARCIERDPSTAAHWLRLVSKLGPIESSSNLKSDIKNEDKKDECWCTTRRSEWQDNFFHSPNSSQLTVKPEFVMMVLDAIDSIEFPTVKMKYEGDSSSALPESSGFKCSLGWIWDSSSCMNESHQTLASLPAHIQHVIGSTDEIDASMQAIQMQLPNDPICESLCLRIVVAHHMFGDCDFVNNSIWWLAVKHWRALQEQQSSTALITTKAGLTWLSLQGFDITYYIKAKHKQATLTMC